LVKGLSQLQSLVARYIIAEGVSTEVCQVVDDCRVSRFKFLGFCWHFASRFSVSFATCQPLLSAYTGTLKYLIQ